MPFKSAEIALLYLKCAEILTGKPCGIYELVYKRGDLRYRIFESGEALQTFLKKHPDVKHDRDEPIYRSKKHVPVQENQVHYLSKKEINTYLQERKALGFRDT